MRILMDPHQVNVYWRVVHGRLEWGCYLGGSGWHLKGTRPAWDSLLHETEERLVLWTDLYLNPQEYPT